MSTDSRDFAHLLNQCLNDHDRSAAWLARQIGVNRATVSRWLNGETAPRQAAVIRAIAAALDLEHDRTRALLHALGLSPQDDAAPDVVPAWPAFANGNRSLADFSQPGERRAGSLAPLIARHAELDVLCAQLRDPEMRLITVVGPGGIGKSRLAAEAAWIVRHDFDLVCSLSFTDAHSFTSARANAADQQLLHRISDALDVTFDDGVSQSEQLIAFLRNRTVLLVLDSFEEALRERTALARLLQESDTLRVLVTSQERLGLEHEKLLSLTGLPTPPVGTPAADLLDHGAAQLFVERVRQVTPAFSVDERDASAVVTICHAVAGFPLGLLLAAGLYTDLPCAEIAALLLESPAALHATPAGIEPRHTTLDGVFNSAWQRLTPEAQRLLSALSIFRQSFTRDDAQQVLGASALQLSVDGQTQDGIVYLLRKSFLRIDRASNRYVMDPPLYRFVADKRARTGDPATIAALERRHAAHFIQRLHTDAAASLHGDSAAEARFLAAWYDIRAALFRRLAHDGIAAVRADVNLACDFFDLRSRHQDVIDFVDEMLARAQPQAESTGEPLPALWLFRKGEACYKNGQIHASKQILLTTLELLGEPVNMLRETRPRDPRILPELVAQVRLRAVPGWMKRPMADAANLELRARVHVILAQIFFFDDESALTEYVILRAANLAEQADAPLELQARALASLCVGLSLSPASRILAPAYADLSMRMADALQSSSNPRERAACAYVLVVLTLYELATGKLPAAHRHAALASQINRELGKYRGYVESTTMEIAAAELSGAHCQAWPAWRDLRNLAEARGDAQIRRWTVAGEIENRLRLGCELDTDLEGVSDAHTLAAYLAELIEASRNEEDRSVLLNLHGLLALVSLRHRLDDRLLDDLRRLHAEVMAADVTKITDFFGYAAAAEATAMLSDEVARSQRTLTAPQQAELAQMADATCGALEAYARVFPVARCRALTWRGLLHSSNGDGAEAERCWRQSAQRAEKFGLHFDQGLAYFEWGRHAAPGTPARQVQLAQSRALFQDMDNPYMVGLIDAELGVRGAL